LVLVFILFEAKTNSTDGRKTLWLWEDVTTRRDFFPFTFFLRPSPLMPFCYSKVVVFPPRLLLNYSSYFYTASYNIQQQQPTHKHLKDTPTRWPYALLCGYLYQNCPAHLQYIEPNNTVCVCYLCVGGPNFFQKHLDSQSSQTSVSYRRPPYRGGPKCISYWSHLNSFI
jgi:hypothetical protein